MADTLGNIKLIANTWTDLYAASGIAVGTRIAVQNIGVCDVSLGVSSAIPADEDSTQVLLRGQFMKNDQGDSGAWAYCQSDGGHLNVRVL